MAEIYIPASSLLPFEVMVLGGTKTVSANYTVYVGDTLDIPMPITYNGQPVNLSQAVCDFVVAVAPANPPLLEQQIQPPLPSVIRLADADTVQLSTGKFYYEIEYDNGDGLTATVQNGYITLLPDTA